MEKNSKAQREEVLGEGASPLSQEPLSNLKLEALSKSRGLPNLTSQTNAGSVRAWAFKEGLPHFKRQRAVSRGNA